MKRTRILAMMLAVLLFAVGLGGCVQTPATSTGATSQTPSGDSQETTPASKPANDPFAKTVHFTATGNPTSLSEGVNYMNDAIYQLLNKKYNFTFEVYPTTYDNWADKNRLWITAGDMPDTVFWNLEYSEYVNYAQQGLIKALPDGWENDYPNLAKSVDATGVKEKIKLDGKTYAIPLVIFYALSPLKPTVAHMSLYYRADWLTKLGMEPFGDIITLDQMESYAKGCISSGLCTAGLDASFGNIVNMYVSMSNPGWNMFYKKDGKYVWGPAQPETLDGIKLLKKYYDNGVIDADFYLNKAVDQRNQFYSGLNCLIIDTGNVDDVQMRYTEFQKANPDLDAYAAIKLTTVAGPDGKYHGAGITNFWSSMIYSPKIEDETLTRLLAMEDYLATTEGQELVRMGIEGTDWKRTADGYELLRAKNPDGTYPSLGTVYPSFNFWWVHPILPDDFSFANPSSNKQIVNNVLGIYTAKMQGDVLPSDPDYNFFASEAKARYSVDVNSEIIKLIMDKNADLDAEWAAFLESQSVMSQPVLDDLNKAFGK